MTFDPAAGILEFNDGVRTVIANDGKLTGFLPPGYSYIATINVVFPDVPKDYAYKWWWSIVGPMVGNWGYDNGCASQVTALPQKWTDETVLAAAPGMVDIQATMARINRISAPSHSWGGSPIEVKPKQNVWLPFTGSVLVEAELGFARAFSIYLKDNPNPLLPPNLVLHRDQSVGAGAGGFGTYGMSPTPSPGGKSGGTWYYGAAAGIPIIDLGTRDSDGSTLDNSGYPPKNNHDIGQVEACPTSVSSNFSSTYQVELIASLGRAS